MPSKPSAARGQPAEGAKVPLQAVVLADSFAQVRDAATRTHTRTHTHTHAHTRTHARTHTHTRAREPQDLSPLLPPPTNDEREGKKYQKTPLRSVSHTSPTLFFALLVLLCCLQRFRPITLERPKVLLPLVNVPMIEYTLEFLASNGVEEVFVFCCAHAEQITSYIENSSWASVPGFTVHTIVSTACISAGEALRLIDHRHVVRADFILISGDTVANMNLRRALDAHRTRRATEKLAIMTVCFKPLTQQQREEHLGESNLVVAVDPTINRVLHYDENPSPGVGGKSAKLPPLALDASLFSEHPNVRVRTDLQDCHVDICAPELLYLFTDNFDYQQLRRDFVVGTLNERELGNNIYAHELGPREYATRVHNLRTYDAVSRDVIGRWVYPMAPDVNSLPRGVSTTYAHVWPHQYAEANVTVDPTAVIGAGTVLGEGCVIGAGAVVKHSVIGRGAVVEAGCRVEGSYIMAGVRLGRDARLTAALVCEGAVVHAGATVGKGAVISYNVVLGAGYTAPEYARLSLARQPEAGDDDDSDDELEVGSFNERSKPRMSIGRNTSNSSLGGGGGGGGGGGFGGDDSDDDEVNGGGGGMMGSGVKLNEMEARLLARAKDGAAAGGGGGGGGLDTRAVWAAEEVGAGGAGYMWAPRWGEEEWRFSIAPAPPGAAAAAYDYDDDQDSDDDAAHKRAGGGKSGGGGGDGDGSDGSGSDDDDDAGGETVFRREVAETFLRCVKHGYAQANAVVELQGLKMAENRTFADIARYVLMTILGLSLPAPRDVTKENSKLYPAKPPETPRDLLNGVRERVKQWAPLLTRFLKSEDDQVEMLLTLEDYCAEDEVFKGMGGAHLVPAFAKILHMLYEMDVLSEVSVLAWAEEKTEAEEEDKRFLKLAQPFVDWLKDADEESEGESSDEESEEESDDEEEE
jgi:translation initiation factor eIF-2B subunit epsilon